MTGPITRLNPDFPACWEDVDTLRFGFETAVARLEHPSAGAQRLIAKLAAGLPSRALLREAEALGSSGPDVRRTLSALAPVLEEADPAEAGASPPRVLRVRIADGGREAVGLASGLLASGACAVAAPGRPETGGPAGFVLDGLARSIDVAVLVERFIEPLDPERRWLADAVPHLPIRFTDAAVHVGPLLEAGDAPCHACISLALIDDDPAAPLLGAQLLGKRPSAETSGGAHMAAAVAAMTMREWVAGGDRTHRERFVIPMRRGRVAGPFRALPVDPHPECACSIAAPAPGADADADARGSDRDPGLRDEA